MESTETELPVKPDADENKDDTATPSKGVQKFKYDLSSLSDNLETTISSVKELKMPLDDLLKVVSHMKTSLETFIDALGVTENLLRNTMNPPGFFQYIYDTLDTAFTEYEKKHPDFEWTGKLVKDEWLYNQDTLKVPSVNQTVIFGMAKSHTDNRKPQSYRGNINTQRQRLQKLAYHYEDEYFYGTYIGIIYNFYETRSDSEDVDLYFGADRMLHAVWCGGNYDDDDDYYDVARVSHTWDIRELSPDKVLDDRHKKRAEIDV
jgi:hypothetical protein